MYHWDVLGCHLPFQDENHMLEDLNQFNHSVTGYVSKHQE